MLRRYRRCAISARLETSRDDYPSKTLFANVNLVPELTTPAILLLSFAGGWLLMGEEVLNALSYVGQTWPVVLIVIGLYSILVRKGAHSA